MWNGMEYYTVAGLALLGLIAAATILGRGGIGSRRGVLREAAIAEDDRAIFLFEEDDLLDATPKARSLLRAARDDKPEIECVVALLTPLFPGISRWMRDTNGQGRYRARASGTTTGPAASIAEAEVEYLNGRLRLTLYDADATAVVHPLAIAAMEDELAVLRRMSEETDELAWIEDADGVITWANASYLELADVQSRPSLADTPEDALLPDWPPMALFPRLSAEGGTMKTRRLCIGDAQAEAPLWFDVRSLVRGGQTLHFARDARDLVVAEEQSKMFVQTLTKTFAQLSIGLAIFDKHHRLTTFNPALLDLTKLPVDFLSVRPTLGIVLDRLREAGILQEPRNYRSWKQGVTDLADAAAQGTYCETWTLPSGQTYRVSGRPHPDGAIALLFEDISAEISLTRAFRSQIETAQAVLDTMDEAIGVFSAAGTLTTCNDVFEAAWSPGLGAESLDQVTLGQAVAHWKTRAAPTPLWDRLRVAVAVHTESVEGPIRLANGDLVTCRFEPLPAGAAMFRFSAPRAGAAQIEPATSSQEHRDAPNVATEMPVAAE